MVAGLTVFALRWSVGKIIEFFTVIGPKDDNEPDYPFEYDEDGLLIGEIEDYYDWERWDEITSRDL